PWLMLKPGDRMGFLKSFGYRGYRRDLSFALFMGNIPNFPPASAEPSHGIQISASVMHFIEKCSELAGACGVAQLAQGLSFDLPNAFASDCKPPANLLQRVLRPVLQTKAHLDHFLFTRAEGVQHLRGLFLQIHVHGGCGGSHRGAVFDQVPQVGIRLLANWRLQPNWYPLVL